MATGREATQPADPGICGKLDGVPGQPEQKALVSIIRYVGLPIHHPTHTRAATARGRKDRTRMTQKSGSRGFGFAGSRVRGTMGTWDCVSAVHLGCEAVDTHIFSHHPLCRLQSVRSTRYRYLCRSETLLIWRPPASEQNRGEEGWMTHTHR